jgi:hypothetical protein
MKKMQSSVKAPSRTVEFTREAGTAPSRTVASVTREAALAGRALARLEAEAAKVHASETTRRQGKSLYPASA